MKYTLNVTDIDHVIAAHIHTGKSTENGPIVVNLFIPAKATRKVTGSLAQNSIKSTSLIGPLKGKQMPNEEWPSLCKRPHCTKSAWRSSGNNNSGLIEKSISVFLFFIFRSRTIYLALRSLREIGFTTSQVLYLFFNF